MTIDIIVPATNTSAAAAATTASATAADADKCIPTSPIHSESTIIMSMKEQQKKDKSQVVEQQSQDVQTDESHSTPTSPIPEMKSKMPASPMSPISPIEENTSPERITLKQIQVRIQKRPTSEQETNSPIYETVHLAELNLPITPTLEDIRNALTQCELGDARRDIFFPTWTKSLYVNVKGEDETIETDSQLRTIIAQEQETPHSITLLLQECRNARYSRRKRNNSRRMTTSTTSTTTSTPPIFIPPPMYMSMPAPRADRPIYYDGPTAPMYYHPMAAAAAAAAYNFNTSNGAAAAGGEFAFVPPPFMVPFVYASNAVATATATTVAVNPTVVESSQKEGGTDGK